jgi:uncharacterized protein
MIAAEFRESPFWSWLDVLLFACLAIPSLLGGTVVAIALGALSPVLKANAPWTSMLLFYVFWFGSLYLMLNSRYGRPFWPSLGWTVPERGAIASFLAGPLIALSIGALGILLHTPQKQLPIEKLIQGRIGMVLFGLFSIVLGPLTEELAFRGFLQPVAMRSLGVVPGILVAALPFALLHGPEYAWTWQYVVLIGFAGMIFGGIRYVTRSTLASALTHSAYNLTFFIAYVSGAGKAL